MTSATQARLAHLLARLTRLEQVAAQLSPADLATRLAPVQQAKTQWSHILERAEALAARVTKLEVASDPSAFDGDASDLAQVISRIELLERGVVRMASASMIASPQVARVDAALRSADVSSFDFLKVQDAAAYYALPLEERARLVGAPSPHHMLKTLLVSVRGGKNEDIVADGGADDDDGDSLALVVVQYTAALDAGSLKRTLAKYFADVDRPCLAPAGLAERVLGFANNGVAPVGGLHARAIPIIVAQAIMDLPRPLMVICGGGEPDVKLRLGDFDDWIAKCPQVKLGDVTRPAAVTTTATPKAVVAAATPASPPKAATTAAKRPQAEGPPDDAILFSDLDVRVGLVTKAWRHPDSDKLLCEEIDVGEGQPRPIASGLQQHYPPEALQGQRVVVVCNLKAAKLGGYTSDGMVLCASWDRAVRLVRPPPDAPVGARVVAANEPPREPASSNAVKKKKIFETVAEHLRVGPTEGRVQFKGADLVVAGQPLVCVEAVPGAKVS